MLLLPRFRRAASYLRESITSESQQLGSYGGLGARVSTTLTLAVKRQKIQENTLRILGEVIIIAICPLLFSRSLSLKII